MKLRRWMIQVDRDVGLDETEDDRGEWVKVGDVVQLEERMALVGRIIETMRKDFEDRAVTWTAVVAQVHVDDRMLELLDVVHDQLTVPQRSDIAERIKARFRVGP